jgi:drug/metabolite transporter (DMT)-like permease
MSFGPIARICLATLLASCIFHQVGSKDAVANAARRLFWVPQPVVFARRPGPLEVERPGRLNPDALAPRPLVFQQSARLPESVQPSDPAFALSLGLCGGAVAAALVHGRARPSAVRSGPVRQVLLRDDFNVAFKRVDQDAEKVRMQKPAPLQADEDSAGQSGSWVERAFDGMDMMAVRGWMVAITLIWGINFPVMKLAMDSLDGADATLFTAARFGLAAGTLLPFLGGASAPVLMAGAQVGALIAGGYGCQAAALALGTEASKASFICSLNVLVVAIGSALQSGSISRKTLLACGLAIAGVGFLEMPGFESGFGFNDLLAFGQPIGFGLSYLKMERIMKDHPNDSLALSAMQCLMVFLASGAAATAGSGGFVAPWDLSWDHLLSPEVVAAVVFSGIIATSLTIWLQSIVFSRLPAMEASIILTSEPLWATLFAVLLVGEHVGILEGVGGALIIAACVVNVLPGQAEQAAPPEVQKSPRAAA